MSIRVLIADDHPVVRAGLRLTIEHSGKDIAVVAEAADGMEALKLARTAPADVFILDITMPNLNGMETARELRKVLPRARIIMLSLHDTKAMVEEALSTGAQGYLTKETATRNVVEAVTEVHAGRSYLCPQVARFINTPLASSKKSRRPSDTIPKPLTSQEKRVLQLIAEGCSNKDVAALLELSVNTVHVHRTNLMAKLNLHKQAELVRYAIKAGIAKL